MKSCRLKVVLQVLVVIAVGIVFQVCEFCCVEFGESREM